MKNNTTPTTKKLTLNLSTVRKLQETLTEEQLKAVVGGAGCSGSGGSFGTAVC